MSAARPRSDPVSSPDKGRRHPSHRRHRPAPGLSSGQSSVVAYRYSFGRGPAVALEAMVATSQTRATQAGLRALERGGNAVDAALTAAAVLCVTEPMSTGIGGDAFALVWHDGELIGLDAAGPAPANADPSEPVSDRGPRSVTVPGAVAGWAALEQPIRPARPRRLPRGRDRRRRRRVRRLAADRRCLERRRGAEHELGREHSAPRARTAAGAGRARSAARARPDAPADCERRPRVPLSRRPGGAASASPRGSRKRSRRIWAGVDRAPARVVPVVRGRGAPAADAGRRSARGARPARRPRADVVESGAVRPARARGLARPRARRRRRVRPADSRIDRSPPRGGPGAGRRAARWDGVPVRRRRRRNGGVVHPEPVRRLRLGRRRRPEPGSSSRTVAPASRSTARSSPDAGRITRSSPACSSGTAPSPARSA